MYFGHGYCIRLKNSNKFNKTIKQEATQISVFRRLTNISSIVFLKYTFKIKSIRVYYKNEASESLQVETYLLWRLLHFYYVLINIWCILMEAKFWKN